MRFAKRGLIGMCMALALVVTSVIPAFAAEVSQPSTSSPQIVEVSAKAANEVATPRGSLSGYKSVNVSGNVDGYFVVDVSGSGSPWAGCTLKTSGFSDNATIQMRVVDGHGNEKVGWRSFGPNTEAKNIPMAFVEAGGYKVYVKVANNSNTGNITCWIY